MHIVKKVLTGINVNGRENMKRYSRRYCTWLHTILRRGSGIISLRRLGRFEGR